MTASEMAYEAPDAGALDKGMHSPEHYQAECERLGKPEKWKDYYRNGHTDAKGWSQPYERRANNDWTLEKGHSASQACRTSSRPHDLNYGWLPGGRARRARSELGDIKFDEMLVVEPARRRRRPGRAAPQDQREPVHHADHRSDEGHGA